MEAFKVQLYLRNVSQRHFLLTKGSAIVCSTGVRSKSPKVKSPKPKSPKSKSPMSKSPKSKSPKSKSPKSKSPKLLNKVIGLRN